jgi:hypothetical protein
MAGSRAFLSRCFEKDGKICSIPIADQTQQVSSDEDDEEEDTSMLSSASSISDCIQMKTIQDHIVTLIETKRSEGLESSGGGGGRGSTLHLPGLRRVFLIL